MPLIKALAYAIVGFECSILLFYPHCVAGLVHKPLCFLIIVSGMSCPLRKIFDLYGILRQLRRLRFDYNEGFDSVNDTTHRILPSLLTAAPSRVSNLLLWRGVDWVDWVVVRRTWWNHPTYTSTQHEGRNAHDNSWVNYLMFVSINGLIIYTFESCHVRRDRKSQCRSAINTLRFEEWAKERYKAQRNIEQYACSDPLW